MSDSQADTDGPYWIDGDMMLRVQATGREVDRIVKIGRPFALVGRAVDNDVCLADSGVSARHVYLHLDPRGLYVVDLLSRTGTRIEETGQGLGWVYPGQAFEVAGRRISLLRMRVGAEVCEPGPTDDDLLAEANQAGLLGVTLEPHQGTAPPWELGSELVFMGWSAACGIPVQDKLAARAHCAIVRTPARAFVVDLCGRDLAVGGEPVGGLARLHDGDVLTVGSSRFTIRLKPMAAHLPALRSPHPGALATRPAELVPTTEWLAPTPVDLVPAESHQALVAWLLGAFQDQHGEILRQQGEFQLALTDLVRQIQQDNARLLTAHLERMERIDRELNALRLEIQRRFDAPDAGRPAALEQSPAPPQAVPLRISKPASPEPGSQASTTWLLERVSQLENENRSAWRDLLNRVKSSPRPSS